jgi:hypothetical protein
MTTKKRAVTKQSRGRYALVSIACLTFANNSSTAYSTEMSKHVQTTLLTLFTHIKHTICEVSKARIVRDSSGGQDTAPDTLVPPPKGMMTTSCFCASCTSFTTAS